MVVGWVDGLRDFDLYASSALYTSFSVRVDQTEDFHYV